MIQIENDFLFRFFISNEGKIWNQKTQGCKTRGAKEMHKMQ